MKSMLAIFLVIAASLLGGCAEIATNFVLGVAFTYATKGDGPVDDGLTVSHAVPFESKHFFTSRYQGDIPDYRAVSGNYYDDAGDNAFLLYVLAENGRNGRSTPSETVFRIALLPLRPNELSIRPSLISFKHNGRDYRPSGISVCDHDDYSFPLGEAISPWVTIYGTKPSMFSWNREKTPPLTSVNNAQQSCLWVKFASPPPSSQDTFQIALNEALVLKGNPTKDLTLKFTGAPASVARK